MVQQDRHSAHRAQPFLRAAPEMEQKILIQSRASVAAACVIQHARQLADNKEG